MNTTISKLSDGAISQFRFVRRSSATQVIQASTASAVIVGVSQFEQNDADDCTYVAQGVSLVEVPAATSITVDSILTSDANGMAVIATSSDLVFARSLEEAPAAGGVIRCVIQENQIAADAGGGAPVASQYAGISLDAFASAASVTGINGTYAKVAIFDTNGPSNGLVPDHTSDHITAPVAGDYEIQTGVSFGGTGNTTFDFCIFAGPSGSTVETAVKFRRKIGSGGDVGRAAASYFVTLSAGDVIELYVKSGGTNDTANIANASISAFKL